MFFKHLKEDCIDHFSRHKKSAVTTCMSLALIQLCAQLTFYLRCKAQLALTQELVKNQRHLFGALREFSGT